MLLSLFIIAPLYASTKTQKVAVVDVRRLISLSPEAAKIGDQLKEQFKPRQDKLVSTEKAFKEHIEKFKRDSALMNAKRRGEEQEKLQKEEHSLMQQQAKFQQDAQRAQNAKMQDVMKNIRAMVSEVAKKKNIELVIPAGSLVYFKTTFDITDDVAKRIR